MRNLKDLSFCADCIRKGDWVHTAEGILIHNSMLLQGIYQIDINGDVLEEHNLTTSEGLIYITSLFGAGNKIPNWYLALFSGAATPTTSWTAANFAATAGEITSTQEGFSNATRPAWVPGSPVFANGVCTLDNSASRAVFNTVCTTSINITGCGLLSSNVRGGTAGVLVSAMRSASPRQAFNGDPINVAYTFNVSDV